MLQFDRRHDHGREVFERGDLLRSERPGFGVKHAHRAESVSVAGGKRSARIEPYAGFSERRFSEAYVLEQIGNVEEVLAAGHLGTRCAQRGISRPAVPICDLNHWRERSVSETTAMAVPKRRLAIRVMRS